MDRPGCDSKPLLQGTYAVVRMDQVSGPGAERCGEPLLQQGSSCRPRVVLHIGPDTHVQLAHPVTVWNRSPLLGLLCLLCLLSVQFSAMLAPLHWPLPALGGGLALLVGAFAATCHCCSNPHNLTAQANMLLAAGSAATVGDLGSMAACVHLGLQRGWQPDQATCTLLIGLYAVHALLCVLLIQHALQARRLLAPPVLSPC